MITIDLGSNTLRVLKFDCKTRERVQEFEKVVKTADNISRDKIISKEAKERVIMAIEEAKSEINFDDNKIIAISTEALRVAKNSSEVLNEIENKVGVKFKIISGEEEAKYVHLAVKESLKRLNLKSKNFILIDIGGGSSEIIFDIESRIYCKSFPIGIVTIGQKYRTKESIEKNIEFELSKVREFIEDKLKFVDEFISTAGTPTTIASMKLNIDYKNYNYRAVNGVVLTIDDLDRELNRLLHSSKEERERMVGINRDELIIAGVLIFKEFFKIFNFLECRVIDDGLREGVAISECKKT